MPAERKTGTRPQATGRVVDELRRMIVGGELLPGQQIRQESMAERLGVSRLPIREGLRQLAADGLVSHTPNAGYAVARLSRSEFDQVYLMRRLLETEVLLRLPEPDPERIGRVARINERVVQAAERPDIAAMRAHNHDFHFAVFRLGDLDLLIDQIERLWTWAAPYHAVYLFSEESRRAVLREHAEMIDALEQGDNRRLAEIMDRHRQGAEAQIGAVLESGSLAVPGPS
ncbi:GntR family transcriptional regulator [Nocardiopsis changdeensis]|uniref:GntR family transcriptional regulator n=1 Tax=Nocardiopsis changdeensis TaxID=2831969 RepID=UPI003F46DD70